MSRCHTHVERRPAPDRLADCRSHKRHHHGAIPSHWQMNSVVKPVPILGVNWMLTWRAEVAPSRATNIAELGASVPLAGASVTLGSWLRAVHVKVCVPTFARLTWG